MTSPLSVIENHRARRGSGTTTLLLGLALGVVLAAPARAALVYVSFDGPFFEAPAPRHFGIGESSVDDARAASVPLYRFDPSAVGPALPPDGPITITLQDLQSVSEPPSQAPVSAHSKWSGTNAAPDPGYWLMVSAVEPTVPAPDSYLGPEVSLGIDPDLGWALAQVGELVFPTLFLTDASFMFDVHYLIDRGLPLGEFMGEEAFLLPQLRLSGTAASPVIPEPATALLLGLGLLGLLGLRRHTR